MRAPRSIAAALALSLTAGSAVAGPEAQRPVCRTGDPVRDAQAKLVMDAIFSGPKDRYRPYRFSGPNDTRSFIERTIMTRADSRPIDARWPYYLWYNYPDQLSMRAENFHLYPGTDLSTIKRLVRAEEQWGFYERTIGHDADGADIHIAPLTYAPYDRSRYASMKKQIEEIHRRAPSLDRTKVITDAISTQCSVAAFYRGDELGSVITILDPLWAKQVSERGPPTNLGIHLRMCDRRAHALIYGFKNLDLQFFWAAAAANGATGTARANQLPDLPPGWAETFSRMGGLRMTTASSPAAVCTRIKQLLAASG